MAQDTDNLLAQITQEIGPKELEKSRKANERVNDAYGTDGRGLIVLVVTVSTPAKPDDLF